MEQPRAPLPGCVSTGTPSLLLPTSPAFPRLWGCHPSGTTFAPCARIPRQQEGMRARAEPSREQPCPAPTAFGSEREQSSGKAWIGRGREDAEGSWCSQALPCLPPQGLLAHSCGQGSAQDPEQREQLLHPARLIQSSPQPPLLLRHSRVDLSPGATESASFSPVRAAPV